MRSKIFKGKAMTLGLGCLSLGIILMACGGSSDSASNNPINQKLESLEERQPKNESITLDKGFDRGSELSKILWETLGGGAITFSIKQMTDGRFEFSEFDGLYLSQGDDPSLYHSLSEIFKGHFRIRSSEKDTNPTGSWTYLTFFDRSGIKVKYYDPNIFLDDGNNFLIWKLSEKAEEMGVSKPVLRRN